MSDLARRLFNVVGSMACNLEIANMDFFEYDGFTYD